MIAALAARRRARAGEGDVERGQIGVFGPARSVTRVVRSSLSAVDTVARCVRWVVAMDETTSAPYPEALARPSKNSSPRGTIRRWSRRERAARAPRPPDGVDERAGETRCASRSAGDVVAFGGTCTALTVRRRRTRRHRSRHVEQGQADSTPWCAPSRRRTPRRPAPHAALRDHHAPWIMKPWFSTLPRWPA